MADGELAAAHAEIERLRHELAAAREEARLSRLLALHQSTARARAERIVQAGLEAVNWTPTSGRA
jgi:hypothetical protein